jgi:CheY-like chemotaxis protein
MIIKRAMLFFGKVFLVCKDNFVYIVPFPLINYSGYHLIEEFSHMAIATLMSIHTEVIRMIGRQHDVGLVFFANDGAGPSSNSSAALRQPERQPQRPSILVVDDERDIAEMFGSALRRAGFDVKVFIDPKHALSNYKAGAYDLVLLDVRMPGMNGFELCSAIRQLEPVRVCFISAYEIHEEEMRNALPEFEVSCIIRKPVSIRDLVDRVRKELENSN